MLPRSSRREEGRLLQSWEAQTCGRSPSSHLLCCLCSRLCYWELCEPHPAPPSSRAVPAESQLLPGLTLGANTGSAQETWAKHGPMREKCMHENFSDGLSFSSWISSACLFSKLKINSYTLPVRFIIPQVKIPFLSQSKDAGREREFLHAFLLWVSWDLKRTVKLCSMMWCSHGAEDCSTHCCPAAWWDGEYTPRSELGAPTGPCKGTSAAPFTPAMGYWPEENVSSLSLQTQAWQLWGAGQPVLASGGKAG